MGQKLFIAVGEDLTETEINPEQLKGGDIILVKIGNDTYPVTDPDQIRSAAAVIKPMLEAHGITVPILFWNHTIDISRINIRGAEVKDAT